MDGSEEGGRSSGSGNCVIWSFAGPRRIVPLRGLRGRGRGLDSAVGRQSGGLGLCFGTEKTTGTEFVMSLLPFQKPQPARTNPPDCSDCAWGWISQVLQTLLGYTYISNLCTGEGETNPNLRTTNHPYINFPYPNSSF
jgi:hypothetical protein